MITTTPPRQWLVNCIKSFFDTIRDEEARQLADHILGNWEMVQIAWTSRHRQNALDRLNDIWLGLDGLQGAYANQKGSDVYERARTLKSRVKEAREEVTGIPS